MAAQKTLIVRRGSDLSKLYLMSGLRSTYKIVMFKIRRRLKTVNTTYICSTFVVIALLKSLIVLGIVAFILQVHLSSKLALLGENKNATIVAPTSDEEGQIGCAPRSTTHREQLLRLCPLRPPGLKGTMELKVDSVPSLAEQEKIFADAVLPGGRFQPASCRARIKVAIIVPFRDRDEHLAVLLYHLHSLLPRQQIDYAVYVVEQAGNGKFNRAKLKNIGFIEALKLDNYDCFIFHDVDMIPENDKILYKCASQPKHMSTAVSTLKYELPYNTLVGGVLAMTVSQMRLVNGFSNTFWGWGGEDDDMANRILLRNLRIHRYCYEVGRYTMLPHKKDNTEKGRIDKLIMGTKMVSEDGLNTMKYNISQIHMKKLYSWIHVNLYNT